MYAATMPAVSTPRVTRRWQDREPEPAEPLFHDAESAVRFAVTLEGQPAKPSVAAMISSGLRRVGRGFRGMDAAAQAGMILQALQPLGRLPQAALIASIAPRRHQCSCKRRCCSGSYANPAWAEAIETLVWESPKALPKGSRHTQFVRRDILLKLYGDSSIKLETTAQQNSLHEKTVIRHYKVLRTWLRGGQDEKGNPVQGIEPAAWNAADGCLRIAGIVGDLAADA